MGELRERRRVTLPLAAGLAGMAVPALIYVAVNAGKPVGARVRRRRCPPTPRSRSACSRSSGRTSPTGCGRSCSRSSSSTTSWRSIVIATRLLAARSRSSTSAIALVAPRRRARRSRVSGFRTGVVYLGLGVLAWLAMTKSGVDPVVVGLAMGLMTYATPASRTDLERASDLFRLFREQPTPELARSATHRRAERDLSQRPAAAAVPSLDELRDRAALRAREHRDPDRRGLPLAGPTPRR